MEGSTNHPTDMNLGRGSGGQKQSISSQISHSSASSESARDKVVLSARNATVPSLEIKEYWIVIYVTNVQSPSKFHVSTFALLYDCLWSKFIFNLEEKAITISSYFNPLVPLCMKYFIQFVRLSQSSHTVDPDRSHTKCCLNIHNC